VEARLASVYEIFKLNSRLYLNCLDGLDDDRAAWRPTAQTNSMGFVALHVFESRYHVATLIRVPATNPFADLTRDAKSNDDLKTLPPVQEMAAAWKALTGDMRVRFGTMTGEDLVAPSGERTPMDDRSLLGVLSFLMQHESYHVGQLALLRKQVGLSAMSYR